MPPVPARHVEPLAVVVFTNQAGLPWLRWLKPGFRHCFAYLPVARGWIAMQPLSHRLLLEMPDWPPVSPYALARHLRGQGYCALAVPLIEPPRRLAPPLPFSCVEAVKRLLGIHSWKIWTPWELYLHIRNITLDDDDVSFYICP